MEMKRKDEMMGLYQISIVILGQVSILYQASFWISAIVNSGGYIEKLSAYECGFEPLGDARMKFDILYYQIGILYLIFDLEIIFLFPLATIMFSQNSLQSFWFANIFQIIVTIGFIYEWNVGALDLVVRE